MAKTAIATVTVNDAEGVLTFSFTNGTTRMVNVNDLSAEMRKRAELHGLEQKLRDSYAGNEEKFPSIGDRVDAFDKVWSNVQANDWNARREGGGESASAMSILATVITNDAVARGKETTRERVLENLQKLSREQRDQLRKKFAVAIAELKAATAPEPEVSTDDLL